MKKILLTMSALLCVNMAFADDMCTTTATEKKLNGAARTSFIKKCQKDASTDVRAMCEKDDISMKTSGAAKEAHIKKCMKDAAAK